MMTKWKKEELPNGKLKIIIPFSCVFTVAEELLVKYQDIEWTPNKGDIIEIDNAEFFVTEYRKVDTLDWPGYAWFLILGDNRQKI